MNPFVKKECDAAKARELAKACGIGETLAALLVMRGIAESRDADAFLRGTASDLSDPAVFPDLERVKKRIYEAVRRNEKIVVYGDYDCDGVGATAIFELAFRAHGTEIEHYIPVRAREGYGLNADAVRRIHARFKPDLLITADCGIGARDEIRLAESLGIDVIVTDHHRSDSVELDCPVLDPAVVPGAPPLCAAGVAFTLVGALWGIDEALKYADICAVSTIADIVPLVGDNRIIVKRGLEEIRKMRCRPGLKELFFASGADMRACSAEDIAFKIAPKINAAGRLETAELALELLTSDDATNANLLARELVLLNSRRQTMNERILSEAEHMLRDYDFSRFRLIMLKGDWAEGVVGIVCSKLVERFNLPAILLCERPGEDILKGSARSIPGVDMFELLSECRSRLVSCGGHAMAAGLALRARDFEATREEFNAHLASNHSPDAFVRHATYDLELRAKDLTKSLIRDLCSLEPFGFGNPRPRLLDDSAEFEFKRIGATEHIAAELPLGELVAFNRLRHMSLLNRGAARRFTYSVRKNIFRNRETNRFVMKDLELSPDRIDDADAVSSFCRTFLPQPVAVRAATRSGEFPTLYASYSAGGAREFLAARPDIDIVVKNSETLNMRDTLVIAPDPDFPFFYYSRIVFLDYVGEPTKRMFLESGADCFFLDRPAHREKIAADELRDLYRALRRNLIVIRKDAPLDTLFSVVRPDWEKTPKNTVRFIISMHILAEIGLLRADDDDIIRLSGAKADLGRSALFRYVNG